MLMPINGISQTNYINKIEKTNKQTNREGINKIGSDEFAKREVFFQGRGLMKLRAVHSDGTVKCVKADLTKNLESWKKSLYNGRYDYLKEHRPDHKAQLHGHTGTYNTNNIVDRILVGVMTLGITEIERMLENDSYRDIARNYVDKMVVIRSELENIKFNEKIAETNKKTAKNANEIKYEASIQDVKNNEIRPKLLDKIQRFREGRPTEMPNCVMFSHKDEEINTKLIHWVEEHVNGNFTTIDNEKLLEELDKAEENYQRTGDWNILYVPVLEKSINTATSDKKTIATYKDIMSNCAEDYHTTLIFKTRTPEKLDSIALQPHRVTKIDMSKIKSMKDLEIASAKERLDNATYTEETPIAALNDLLLISGNQDKALNWDYSSSDFEQAEEALKNLSSDNNSEFSARITTVLNSLRNIW